MKALEGYRILVVEDVAIIAMDVADMLERQGAVVRVAMNFRQGMHEAKDAYHAALLDGKLIEDSSLPIAAELQAKNIPVIFHSGHVDQSSARQVDPKCKFLPKPATDRAIVGAILHSVRAVA